MTTANAFKNEGQCDVTDLLGRTVAIEEAHEGTAFLSHAQNATYLNDPKIVIHAFPAVLIVRIYEDLPLGRYVEMTIPKNEKFPVEFRTSQAATMRANQEVY